MKLFVGLLFLSIPAVPLLALLVLLLLALTVYLFVSLKMELRSKFRSTITRAEVEKMLAQLTGEREEERARVDAAERDRRSPAGWTAAPGSLNLNRRAQVLRLHRQGRRVPEIASALHIPQGEVGLMVKVQELSAKGGSEINK